MFKSFEEPIARHAIDIQTWNRREHFVFFSAMDNPYCGVTLKADVSQLWAISQRRGIPFNTVVMHALTKASDAVPYMRYRIDGDRVVECEHLHIGGVELREDHTIGFSYFKYEDSLEAFGATVPEEQARVKSHAGLAMHPEMDPLALIFYSALPWFSFSEMNHASCLGQGGGVLRCSVGRYELMPDGQRQMPISVTFHHGLVFAYDLHCFIKAFEAYSEG